MQPRLIIIFTLAAVLACVWALFSAAQKRPAAEPMAAIVSTPPSLLPQTVAAEPAERSLDSRQQLPPVSAAVQAKVEALIRKYRGKVPKDVSQEPELAAVFANMGSLMERISPEDQRRIDKTLEATRAVIGSQHGSISFEMKDMDAPATRALLEAVISDDPSRLADYMIRSLDGANFEYAISPGLRQSSDGLILQKAEAPKTSAPVED
ncbi:hypothetical protein [Prosthecobacter sp.]|uniref:hypothetical protein n=1 Tax=Prosthecobacter sp. TaxID=1965333 RepID=UPI00378462C2